MDYMITVVTGTHIIFFKWATKNGGLHSPTGSKVLYFQGVPPSPMTAGAHDNGMLSAVQRRWRDR